MIEHEDLGDIIHIELDDMVEPELDFNVRN